MDGFVAKGILHCTELSYVRQIQNFGRGGLYYTKLNTHCSS